VLVVVFVVVEVVVEVVVVVLVVLVDTYCRQIQSYLAFSAPVVSWPQSFSPFAA
jgi:hypothetical protein